MRQFLEESHHLFMEVLTLRLFETEEVVPLPRPDDDADPGREANNDGVGDELHQAAQLGHAHDHQDHPGHQGGDLQPIEPVLRRNAGQDDDEGAGRTRNLQAAATERGGNKTGHNRGVDTILGFRSRGNGKGHRQRQSHQADHDACNDVGEPIAGSEIAAANRLLQRCVEHASPDAVARPDVCSFHAARTSNRATAQSQVTDSGATPPKT